MTYEQKWAGRQAGRTSGSAVLPLLSPLSCRRIDWNKLGFKKGLVWQSHLAPISCDAQRSAITDIVTDFKTTCVPQHEQLRMQRNRREFFVDMREKIGDQKAFPAVSSVVVPHAVGYGDMVM
jgi:hypothetical protein